MEKKKFKIKYLDNYPKNAPKVMMPREDDIGIDLIAAEDLFIPEGTAGLISTGISIELPEGYWLQLLDRSSISNNCHIMAGIIDTSYTGEILIRMYCHRGAFTCTCTIPQTEGMNIQSLIEVKGFPIKEEMRIAQGIIRKNYNSEFEIEEVDHLSRTERDDKGFGSTDV